MRLCLRFGAKACGKLISLRANRNTIYETDPAAKRASVEASSKIRENFEKLQLANRVAEGGEDPSIDWGAFSDVFSSRAPDNRMLTFF